MVVKETKQQNEGRHAVDARLDAGVTAREEFGSRQVATTREHGTAGAISKAQEEVRAPYVMAERRPRDMAVVREDLLAACRRPKFATASRYAIPRGKCRTCEGKSRDCQTCNGTGKNIVEGWTIRFAEGVLDVLPHVRWRKTITSDGAKERVIRVEVTDYHTCRYSEAEFALEKTVERRTLKEGQVSLGTRPNSWGDRVYLMPATEDDLRLKEAAGVSRALRDLVLRLIPADIREEALEVVTATMRENIDASVEREKAIAAFATLGPPVTEKDLERYIGHPLAKATVNEFLTLRNLYAGLSTGETTWAEVVGEEAHAAGAAEPEKPRAEALKEKLAKQAKPSTPAPAPKLNPATGLYPASGAGLGEEPPEEPGATG